MTLHLGYVAAGSTLYIPFHTFDSNGASITLTGLAVTDIEIYKNGSVTQRSSDAGYTLLDTDGIDFDGLTGIHGFSVDLSDNTDAGFYAAGNTYWIVVSAVTVDTRTVSFVAATFFIGPIAANATQFAGQTITAAAGVTLPSSVASPTNITAATGITVSTNNDKTGYTLSSAGIQAVWDALTSALTAVGSIGKLLVDNINATISSRLATSGYTAPLDAAGTRTAVGLAAANLDTQLTAIDDFLDTEVAAIKAKTDSLTFTVAGQVDSNVQAVNDVALTGDGSATPWGPA